MTEALNIMVGLSILLSAWACVSWMRVSRTRELRRLDGRTIPEPGDADVARQLLFLLITVDGFAAIFALITWWSPR